MQPPTRHGSQRAALGFFIVVTFTALVYLPGLSGPFVFDDYNNIVQNKAIAAAATDPGALWQALLGGFAGPLKRPLSTLSFVLNLATTGLTPFWFKLTNVLIHLLNGVLVFLVARGVLRLRNRLFGEFHAANALALVAAAIWLVHPAQLTSVLYVVQRMTSLSASFLFAGLYLYVVVRTRIVVGKPARALLWIGVPLCGLLSVLTKENGALLFLYIGVLEFTLLGFRGQSARTPGGLVQWLIIFGLVPAVLAAAWLLFQTDWSGAPSLTRPFNPIERLLTETRVLFLYLRLLVLPTLPDLALFYDDFTISRSLIEPWTTVLAVLGLVSVVVIAIFAHRRLPWFAFGVLWFVVGHLIESTVILLELIHIHRNYVAYLGPILAAVVLLGRMLTPRRARLGAMLATAVVVGFGAATAQRAHQWNDPYALATYEVLHRPNSARANYELGRLYFIAYKTRENAEHRMRALRYFERAMSLDPYSIGAPVALLILRGGTHYVARDAALDALLARLEARPMISKEIHFFRSLIECQADEACRRPPPELLEVFARAVAHHALTAEMKADILAIMGLYYANTLNDLPACIRTMEESVKAMPQDPNYQLNLAQAYLVARRFDDAKRTIEAAERLDRFGAYARRIATLRRDLPLLEREQG